jgi:hypothetical protein
MVDLKPDIMRMPNKSMGIEILFKELFNNKNNDVVLYEIIIEGADSIVKNFYKSAEIIGELNENA